MFFFKFTSSFKIANLSNAREDKNNSFISVFYTLFIEFFFKVDVEIGMGRTNFSKKVMLLKFCYKMKKIFSSRIFWKTFIEYLLDSFYDVKVFLRTKSFFDCIVSDMQQLVQPLSGEKLFVYLACKR